MDIHQLGSEGNSAGQIHTQSDQVDNRKAKLAEKAAKKRELRKNPEWAEKEKENCRLWRERNREKLRRSYREFNAANRDSRYESKKKTMAKNPEKYKSYQAEYRAKNKSKAQAYMAKWTQDNKESLKQKSREYLPRRLALNKRKRATDPIQRLKDACRTRVGFILRKAGVPKFNHTFELVGCTPDFLKSHLTALFKPGMTWDNYGSWEIDHIRPLAAFNLGDEAERLSAFHYSNCQPLWKIENRMKNCRL